MTANSGYHGTDLRGHSFRGLDLDGADFAETDLRGADFTNASLRNANFTNARLGVRPILGLIILAVAMATAVAAGVATGYFAEAIRVRATSSGWQDLLAGGLLLVVVITFFAILIRRGLGQAFRFFLLAAAAAVVLDVTVVFFFGTIRPETFGVVGLLFLFAPAAVAGILGRIVGGTFGAWAITAVAMLGGFAAGKAHGGFAAVVVSLLLILISKRALSADERDRPIRRLAHRIVTRRGTKFAEANLTGADFTGTLLIQSDMSRAVLSDAKWDPGRGPVLFDDDST